MQKPPFYNGLGTWGTRKHIVNEGQRDNTAARISELEAALENLGADGSLQNGFVSTFGKYLDVKEITSEITAEVLKEVLVYPGNRFEIIWNCREELKNLILDLQ